MDSDLAFMERPLFRKKRKQLGKGFSLRAGGFLSSVSKERGISDPSRKVNQKQSRLSERIFLAAIFFGGFILLFSRLFYVTVVNGRYYRELSEGNRIRQESILPKRGVVYARNGEILAENRPIYKLCKNSNPPSRTAGSPIRRAGDTCQVLDRDEALEKEAKGGDIVVELGRDYPESTVSAHLVGYMAEIDKEQLESENARFREIEGVGGNEFCQSCYLLGDYIGADGSEKAFEKRLRGIPGKRLIEVDATQKEIRELARVDPIDGENITLSIDLDLQRSAAESLEKQIEYLGTNAGGAVVALDPKTGEVLALYSSPTFDPNLFVNSDLPLSQLEKTLSDERQPLFNRALGGLYPPGSTFKIITAAAGLEEGAINASTTVEDKGVITIGEFEFSNWLYTKRGATEGDVDIVEALRRSNDIFFYKLGEWVGADNLEKWSKTFGLGKKIGIELSGAEEGIVRRKRKWYLGDTYHLAIGQGDLLVTPLHVASWTQTLANDGVRCMPTIEKGSKAECSGIGLSKETVKLIQQGLRQACSPGGTGWTLFNFSVNTASGSPSLRKFEHDGKDFIQLENGGTQIQIACKTGTAEFGDPKDKTHAWLTAYAPSEKPEIVVTVLLEKGGEGSNTAGIVVKEILQTWFGKARPFKAWP